MDVDFRRGALVFGVLVVLVVGTTRMEDAVGRRPLHSAVSAGQNSTGAPPTLVWENPRGQGRLYFRGLPRRLSLLSLGHRLSPNTYTQRRFVQCLASRY
jgi:hypothetical protein